MKCPQCGKDVEMINKQVGVDANNQPLFNEYAICRTCKKQWNLDKQRTKKVAAKPAKEEPLPPQSQEQPAAAKPKKPASKIKSQSQTLEKAANEASDEVKKTVAKRPKDDQASIRKKPAGASAAADQANAAKTPARKKMDQPNTPVTDKPNKTNAPDRKKTTKTGTATAKRPVPVPLQSIPVPEEPKAKLRPVRIIFGILCILAFAYAIYKGFMAGLDNIAEANTTNTGTAYIILSVGFLLSGLVLLITQKKNTILAFIIPTVLCLAGGVFAFLKRDGEQMLLSGAIISGIFAFLFIILALIFSHSNDADYEDPFEDEHDN